MWLFGIWCVLSFDRLQVFLHDMEKLGEQIDISKVRSRPNSMVSTVACYQGGPGPKPGKGENY